MFAAEMRKALILLLVSMVCLSIQAMNPADTVKNKPLRPRFLYNVDAAVWFDNREYKGPIQIPQTLLFDFLRKSAWG